MHLYPNSGNHDSKLEQRYPNLGNHDSDSEQYNSNLEQYYSGFGNHDSNLEQYNPDLKNHCSGKYFKKKFGSTALFYKEWIIFLLVTHTIFIFFALSVYQDLNYKSLKIKALHETLVLDT